MKIIFALLVHPTNIPQTQQNLRSCLIHFIITKFAWFGTKYVSYSSYLNHIFNILFLHYWFAASASANQIIPHGFEKSCGARM